jgi:hypothetical protein
MLGHRLMRGTEGHRWRFTSSTTKHGRASYGGARCDGASWGSGGSGVRSEEGEEGAGLGWAEREKWAA